jgi:hypothetical protein
VTSVTDGHRLRQCLFDVKMKVETTDASVLTHSCSLLYDILLYAKSVIAIV